MGWTHTSLFFANPPQTETSDAFLDTDASYTLMHQRCFTRRDPKRVLIKTDSVPAFNSDSSASPKGCCQSCFDGCASSASHTPVLLAVFQATLSLSS